MTTVACSSEWVLCGATYYRCAKKGTVHAYQRGTLLRLIGPDSDRLDWGLAWQTGRQMEQQRTNYASE